MASSVAARPPLVVLPDNDPLTLIRGGAANTFYHFMGHRFGSSYALWTPDRRYRAKRLRMQGRILTAGPAGTTWRVRLYHTDASTANNVCFEAQVSTAATGVTVAEDTTVNNAGTDVFDVGDTMLIEWRVSAGTGIRILYPNHYIDVTPEPF